MQCLRCMNLLWRYQFDVCAADVNKAGGIYYKNLVFFALVAVAFTPFLGVFLAIWTVVSLLLCKKHLKALKMAFKAVFSNPVYSLLNGQLKPFLKDLGGVW